ncbi:Collagen type IV alpha-3-binding protein [Trichinella spiralis]|uniref:Ceramide transfer protein n=1 Tax=Trichinella spiralis TaxID=6334 RepID=A0A0V1BBP0_TRISP|nr:Collagen type IV alpha-3-binding protein [Trichinella spiralis]
MEYANISNAGNNSTSGYRLGQISGITLTYLIALAGQILAVVFIMAKRRVVRNNLLLPKNPYSAAGTGASARFRAKIQRGILLTSSYKHFHPLLVGGSEQERAERFRRQAVDSFATVLTKLGSWARFRWSRHSLPTVALLRRLVDEGYIGRQQQVTDDDCEQFASLYDTARYTSRPFGEQELDRFVLLYEKMFAGVESWHEKQPLEEDVTERCAFVFASYLDVCGVVESFGWFNLKLRPTGMYHITSLGTQSLNLAKRTIKRALSSHQQSDNVVVTTSQQQQHQQQSTGTAEPLVEHQHPPARRAQPQQQENWICGNCASSPTQHKLCADGFFQTTSSASRNDDNSNCAETVSWSSEGEPVESACPILTGVLNKWTNYIHGWQPRYFVLQAGTLAYYKSEQEIEFGCRGAITVSKAIIQMHDYDDCRVDISVNDCVWYLRADRLQDRQRWLDAIEAYRADSGYGSQGDLCRHGSLVSLTSNKSLASSSSFKVCQGLNEKISELETYREIVLRQIDTLQSYFDSCAEETTSTWNIPRAPREPGEDFDDIDADHTMVHPSPHLITMGTAGMLNAHANGTTVHHREEPTIPNAKRAADFRSEALTFKATTAGILPLLQHCTDLVQQSEDAWKRRLEQVGSSVENFSNERKKIYIHFLQETDRRKRADDNCRQLALELQKLHVDRSSLAFGGPDYEEGPHSALKEDEWHDALDAALEKQDLEDRRVERLLARNVGPGKLQPFDKILLSTDHSLFNEIEQTTMEQVKYAQQGVSDGEWQLFSEDGEMKMYRREVEIGGLVCDPLKAVHHVKGVSALEYLHYFYEPDYKMDWDTTLEELKVIERMSEDTMILQQIHKRVWPAAQRESLFWSHIRRVPKPTDSNALDMIVVCNHDTQHAAAPPNSRTVRVGLTIAMVCQTIVENASVDRNKLTRDDVSCKITYVAQVNPRGWAPSSVLRAVYKREYPKFLKRFTQYVLQKVENSPIQL